MKVIEAAVITLLILAGGISDPKAQSIPPAPVTETGQLTSYAAGDDGDLRPGIAWPTPRFVDLNNGSVKDMLTGLIWLKNADCFGVMTWQDALHIVQNVESGWCGLTDGSSAGV